MHFKGYAHRYGRNVDTDVIIPARYLTTSDPAELAKHCLEDLDATFSQRVRPGDIIVAEENFGCGSSREHAPIAIKAAGVDVVIAKSFARIFYRNSINTGLAIMECPEAVDAIKQGDVIAVDADAGTIVERDHRRNVPCPAVSAVHPRNHRSRRSHQPHPQGAGHRITLSPLFRHESGDRPERISRLIPEQPAEQAFAPRFLLPVRAFSGR